MNLDANAIRKDFPILHQQINNNPLVYLDSAATMQKPQIVIDALNYYYSHDNSNVHRGLHALSERSTKGYELARTTVQQFINARETAEIIFTKGTTESINLVANTFGRTQVTHGDEIILSGLEHHANIVPWQVLCQQTGANLKIIKVNDDGSLDQVHFESLFNANTKLLALSHVSNAIGTINPVKAMTSFARARGVPVLIDGAQAVQHMPVDVQDIDCDFYAFSAHKCYGPTGFGVLYGKRALLEAMPPYQTGGEMIKRVTFEKSIYNELPHKFEAGTPHIAGAIGLHAAIQYVLSIGFDTIESIERDLLAYATGKLSQIEGFRIIGSALSKASVISFVLEGIHAHDVGTILDSEGVAVRAGHHCAMPLMDRFQVPATARASFACYNTRDDVDRLYEAILKVKRLFSV